MKKKLLGVLPRSALLAIILVLLMAGVALAVTVLFLVPSDINITTGEVAAKVFLDPECTTPVTAIHWGDIPRGTNQQFVFYIKNTGVETIDCSLTIPQNVSAIMTYSFTPASIHLTAGQSGPITWNASILPTAPLGSTSWTFQGGAP